MSDPTFPTYPVPCRCKCGNTWTGVTYHSPEQRARDGVTELLRMCDDCRATWELGRRSVERKLPPDAGDAVAEAALARMERELDRQRGTS